LLSPQTRAIISIKAAKVPSKKDAVGIGGVMKKKTRTTISHNKDIPW
jgi:hypothetical protein